MITWTMYVATEYPFTFLCSVMMGLTVASCFLLINHMPGRKHWPEKVMIFAVALGAFGIMVAPLFAVDLDPSPFDLLFRYGAAVFSIWMTLPYWRALPFLNRRRVARPVVMDDSSLAS